MSHQRLRYLFWCANEHLDFRIPEFEALAKMFDLKLDWAEKNEEKPWVILNLASEEEASKLLSRSVASKWCLELWGKGASLEGMHTEVKECTLALKYAENSFKFRVEGYSKKLGSKDKIKRIDSFSYLPLKGPVRLDGPDVTLMCLEYYGEDHNHAPDLPLQAFFGRLVGEGQRQLMSLLSIKKRKFIGNTTMDPQLALYMANLACVKPNDLVFDPFVGTGSLLLACAQFGAYSAGADIDYLMLHARTRPSRVGQKVRAMDESLKANFQQLGLEDKFLDVAVADAALNTWREEHFLDAIVADPPYGIREPTSRVGTEKSEVELRNCSN